MKNIFENYIVKNELERLHALIGTDGERNVQYDIDILKAALKKINDFLNGSDSFIVIDGNMWEECHNSLDNIFLSLGLIYDEELSNYDHYKFAIKRSCYN